MADEVLWFSPKMKISHQSKNRRVRQKLPRDVMKVIESNGEVTLPGLRRRDGFLTKRQLQFALLVIGVLLMRWRRSR